MKVLNIHSSALQSAEYDLETKILSVVFKNGTKSYTSINVPEHIVIAFENADSQGKFYASNIKKQFAP